MKIRIIMIFLILISVFTVDSSAESITAKVKGLVCDFCSRVLEQSFERTGKGEDIKFDLDKSEVQIEAKPGIQMSKEEVAQVITDSRYTVDKITED